MGQVESAARKLKVRRDAGDAEVQRLAEAVRRGPPGPVVPVGHPRGPLGMNSAVRGKSHGPVGHEAVGRSAGDGDSGDSGILGGEDTIQEIGMPGAEAVEVDEGAGEGAGLVQGTGAGTGTLSASASGPSLSFVPYGSRVGRPSGAGGAQGAVQQDPRRVRPGPGGGTWSPASGPEGIKDGGEEPMEEEGVTPEQVDAASAREVKPADGEVAEELASVFRVAGRGGVSGGFNGARDADSSSGGTGGSRSKRSGGLSSVTGVKARRGGRQASAPRPYPGYGTPASGLAHGIHDTATSRTPPHLAAAQLAGALPPPRTPLSSLR